MTNALKSTVDDVAEDYLQLELDRLDALQLAIWHSAMAGDIASATTVSSQRPNSRPTKDQLRPT